MPKLRLTGDLLSQGQRAIVYDLCRIIGLQRGMSVIQVLIALEQGAFDAEIHEYNAWEEQQNGSEICSA